MRAAASALAVALALAGAPGVRAAGPPAPVAAARATPATTSPAETARSFYAWYLPRVAHDHDPIRDDRPALARWVSPALVAEIDRRMKSADGLESDPFLLAQDYLDSWLGAVSVGVARGSEARATVPVVLGAGRPQAQRLEVTLLRGPQGWRIRTVSASARR